MRFIDLFAGLGGFHVAASALPLETECVFASEVDQTLRDVYAQNFGICPAGDIRDIDVCAIPDFDILFGGWPCQPFTRIGKRKGFGDANVGDLFFYVEAILRRHLPPYFLLENVYGLFGARMREELSYILSVFYELGYDVISYVLSPNQFGIPQHRRRVFFYGSQTRHRYQMMPVHYVRDSTLPSFGFPIRDIMLDRSELSDDGIQRFMPVTEPRVQAQIKRYCEQHDIVDGEQFVFQATRDNDKFRRSMGIDKGVGHRGTTRTLISSRSCWPIHLRSPHRIFTAREGARLQSFPDSHVLPTTLTRAYSAVGNAINVTVAQRVLEFHLCEMLDTTACESQLKLS